jgi:glycosyltransferase involved in cell wall biosynthesis
MSNLTSNYPYRHNRPQLLYPGQGSKWLKSKFVIPFVALKPALANQVGNENTNLLIKDNATNFTSLARLAKKRIFVDSIVNLQLKPAHMEVGIIVPCYNEEKRLKTDEFRSFLAKHQEHILCFVNDGSSDKTIQVLENLRNEFASQVIVIDCIKNLGKAGAVRAGVNYLKEKGHINYIGFLDADLSTDFDDFLNLIKVIKSSEFKIVTGSRIMRMGANIIKPSSRGIISKSINFLICWMLGMNFQDTQCGAKIMTKEMAEATFKKPFLTRWLFDVEVFMRMKVLYGKNKASNFICEEPLKRWVHAEDSKLGFKDSLKIVFQLFQISYTYWR